MSEEQQEQSSEEQEQEEEEQQSQEQSQEEEEEPQEQEEAQEEASQEQESQDEETEESEASSSGDDQPDAQPQQQEDQYDDSYEEEFEDSVVHINRCCKVVRGGKRFSFSALVVSGNRSGKVGYGFGKANQVPQAIQKAIADSKKRTIDVPVVHGTIPHTLEVNFCATNLLLKPASPGTGIKSSLPVRTVLELAGVTDLLTKIHGSTNPINVVKATYKGLKKVRSKREIEQLRGRKIG